MKLKEIKPGMVIHCKTEEEADQLMEMVGWQNESYDDKTYYRRYGDRTCYEIGLKSKIVSYGDIDDFDCDESCCITEFSKLIDNDLSIAEVIKICNEICDEDVPCDDCKMGDENCFCNRKADYSKIEEICRKWKEDHTTKSPKTIEVELTKEEFEKLKTVGKSDRVVFLCDEIHECFTIYGLVTDTKGE